MNRPVGLSAVLSVWPIQLLYLGLFAHFLHSGTSSGLPLVKAIAVAGFPHSLQSISAPLSPSFLLGTTLARITRYVKRCIT